MLDILYDYYTIRGRVTHAALSFTTLRASLLLSFTSISRQIMLLPTSRR